MIHFTPPEEVLRFLESHHYDTSGLPPLELPTLGSLTAVLEAHVPSYRRWGKDADGSEPYEKFCDDLFLHKEGTVALEHIPSRNEWYVIRSIQTATSRITVDIPSPAPHNPRLMRRKLLKQYRKIYDRLVARNVESSSSETLKRYEYDRPHLHVVARAIQEELDIEVDEEYLQHPYLYPVPPQARSFKLPAADVPQELVKIQAHACRKYPGTLTRNILHEFYWNMPLRFYRPEGYKEPGKENYFLWEDLNEWALQD